MPLSKIVSIQYDGNYPSDYGGPDGLMHTHIVTLEDGQMGQCQTKNQQAPYGPGDEVEYTPNGDYQGMPKFKIKKNVPGGGNFRGGGGGGGSKKSFDTAGAMVGAAIHDAVTLVSHGKAKPNQGEGLEAFVFRIADQICQASVNLKKKWSPILNTQAPQQASGTGRQMPQQAPQQAPQQHNPPPVYNNQGQPVQTQSAHQQPVQQPPQQPNANVTNVPLDEDDDVPF